MKVFFDTNVYVAEALLGEAAEQIVQATEGASWRIYTCREQLEEVERVLTDALEFSRRLASLSRSRILRRAVLVELGASRHTVPDDPNDNLILQAAVSAGVDYLVTNDGHLLALTPYEGLQIVSMSDFYRHLQNEGLLQ
ncbi:MAG: putative toxin-antitoxin system toxin component, PIN family [Burkholderiales bacterium]|nr:putative toxin-antitoxin system toxin component, PIN family [Burkholderiales bacterium]